MLQPREDVAAGPAEHLQESPEYPRDSGEREPPLRDRSGERASEDSAGLAPHRLESVVKAFVCFHGLLQLFLWGGGISFSLLN